MPLPSFSYLFCVIKFAWFTALVWGAGASTEQYLPGVSIHFFGKHNGMNHFVRCGRSSRLQRPSNRCLDLAFTSSRSARSVSKDNAPTSTIAITFPCTSRTTAATTTRLFGTKRGTPGDPPGTIEIYNHQTTIPETELDIPKLKETIEIIRKIIGYPTYDVSLIITEDDEMQQTNLETRGIDRPTDILSFQFQDDVIEPGVLGEPDFDIPEYYNLGDMMVDVPYVMRRCEEDRKFNEGISDDDDDDNEEELDEYVDYVGDDDRGVSGVMSTIYDPQSRMQLLLVHGMLHLVGYDHIEDDDYELMVNKEEEVIKELQKQLNEDWCDIIK